MTYKNVNDPERCKLVRVVGKGSAFVEARFLNLSSGRIVLAESDLIRLWPQREAVNLFSPSDELEDAEYTVLSRDHAATEPMLLTDEAVYMGLDENSYPYSEVSLTPLSDGRYLLVYTGDDLSRAAADRSTLRTAWVASTNPDPSVYTEDETEVVISLK